MPFFIRLLCASPTQANLTQILVAPMPSQQDGYTPAQPYVTQVCHYGQKW